MLLLIILQIGCSSTKPSHFNPVGFGHPEGITRNNASEMKSKAPTLEHGRVENERIIRMSNSENQYIPDWMWEVKVPRW